MSSAFISRGMCVSAHVYLHTSLRLFVRCHTPLYTSRLPLLSKYQLTFLWSDMFRLPPMNPVGERGASLHAPQNSKANHPCRSQQSVQLREKKAARHQQARAIPTGRLSSLCCPPNSICAGID
ncbi:hypothetical protein QQF64_035493 [Cirrhinus molitorella]|uniref:Uncharacterized protein n=1 Tax=Cirrhinus molitorella TaxID=172907 RepID=A0ABR3NFZ2_9TELE